MQDYRLRSTVPAYFQERVLTPEALSFVAHLHRSFNPQRQDLLIARKQRQESLRQGESFNFLSSTAEIRNASWQVASCPKDLLDRRVEITGPVEAKMMINALNSGAKVFMADFEDSCSPTWHNILCGQDNLQQALQRTLSFSSPEGKHYQLAPATQLATLVVRPRGLHLLEQNILVNESPVAAAFCDVALYLFHNHSHLQALQSAPYFYLPKLESHLEARLWNQVFIEAQKYLGLAQGSIRATVLIETLPAAFVMEEILWELKEHAAGLNAGRWDYIFSFIKNLQHTKNFILPDRKQVTMTAPFMRAYTQLLVQSCHKRGAHAIGGMSAFIPSRNNIQINTKAILAVQEDKEREANDGFDGTWVAHPDLVPIAQAIFDRKLGTAAHQKHHLAQSRDLPQPTALLNTHLADSYVSKEGIKENIYVSLYYLAKWLQGLGAVAIHHLMEDAATAEISRAQLWQWLHNTATLQDGSVFTPELYQQLKKEELKNLADANLSNLDQAVTLLDQLILNKTCEDFLTLRAYPYLEHHLSPS